jgi:hypothetical protein
MFGMGGFMTGMGLGGFKTEQQPVPTTSPLELE